MLVQVGQSTNSVTNPILRVLLRLGVGFGRRITSVGCHFSIARYTEQKLERCKRRKAKKPKLSLRTLLGSGPELYWRLFFYSYQCIKSLRHLIASYSLYKERLDYLYYDVYLAGLTRTKLYSAFDAILASPWSVLELLLDHVIEDRLEEYFLRSFFDLVILNGLNFFTLNPELRPKSWRPRDVKAAIHSMLASESAKFHRKRLKRFSRRLAHHIRVRLVLVVLAMEWIFRMVMSLLGIGFMFGSVHYFLEYWVRTNFSPSQCFLAFFEVMLLSFATFNAMKIILFLLTTTIAQSMMHSMQLKSLNGEMTKLYLKLTNQQKISKFLLAKSLENYYQEHWRIEQFTTRLNARILSMLIMVTIVGNALANVFMFRKLFLFSGHNLLLYCALTAIQLMLLRAILMPITYLFSHLYRCGPLLANFQATLMGERFVSDKLKLENYSQAIEFERERRCRGDSRSIMSMSIATFILVIFFYSVFLVLALKLFYKLD